MKTKVSVILATILLLVACAPKATPISAATEPAFHTETPTTVSSETLGSTPLSAVPTSSADSRSGQIEIEIEDFAFRPETITITTGSTIEWKNRDDAPHTVTGDDGSWGSDSLSRDDVFSFTFTQAGTYTYHCKFHQSMKATIIVVNP